MKADKEFFEQIEGLKKHIPKDTKYLFVASKEQEDGSIDMKTLMEGNVHAIAEVLVEHGIKHEEIRLTVLTAALNLLLKHPNDAKNFMSVYKRNKL